MSSTEEKAKQQVSKDSSQAMNPAKLVKAPELPVKHEFSLEKKSNEKKDNKE